MAITLALVAGINHAPEQHSVQPGDFAFMFRSSYLPKISILAIFVLLGGIVTASVALQTVVVDDLDIDNTNLSVDEEAYYEYVAPRLEMLVTEVDATREMVETKSRDIMSLTRAGTVIETLTGEIREYGITNVVPEKFEDVHERILKASGTVNATFDEARTALRTFNFSSMSGLVVGFTGAADEFTACNNDLHALVAT